MEIALTENFHTQMTIESYGRIAAVDIELDPGLTASGSLFYKCDRPFKQHPSESALLLRRQDIYLLKVEEHNPIIRSSFWLYGYIAARPVPIISYEIYVSVQKLLPQIVRGVHPVHHIFHLLRREYVPVSMTESHIRHIVNAHYIAD